MCGGNTGGNVALGIHVRTTKLNEAQVAPCGFLFLNDGRKSILLLSFWACLLNSRHVTLKE